MTRHGDVAQQVRQIAERVAQSYALDIFDVQYRREAPGMVLRVQLDRPGAGAAPEDSVSVEDCANVSRDLSAVLDVEDVVPNAYTLEVSSPGLDRPLRQAADYVRFTGRRAKLVMREPVDGQGYFKGRLAGVESGAVTIETDDGRRREVPLAVITRANLEVEF
ncbi:MAG: ribosome maturation factor RimP [Acidobacteriaceae bacterium]|jgi:ribosome maturation factor RimP|nr:ribosome maturation factor RimP [Acidobacteriaceae bacterium]